MIIPTLADRDGNFTRTVRVSGPLAGKAYIQAIPDDLFRRRFGNSNGLEVDCGK